MFIFQTDSELNTSVYYAELKVLSLRSQWLIHISEQLKFILIRNREKRKQRFNNSHLSLLIFGETFIRQYSYYTHMLIIKLFYILTHFEIIFRCFRGSGIVRKKCIYGYEESILLEAIRTWLLDDLTIYIYCLFLVNIFFNCIYHLVFLISSEVCVQVIAIGYEW